MMSDNLVFQYSECDFLFEVPRSAVPVNSAPVITILPTSLVTELDGVINEETKDSSFDMCLKRKWNEAKRKGLFRYDLSDMETKILPGKYNFVAQLNTKRATERRKPQTITSLLQPFDPNIFNFTKANLEEILFLLEKKQIVATSVEESKGHKERNVVLINISPLEDCNSLLVPNIDKCLSQLLDEDGLRRAVELVLLSSSSALRVGFNSLCGYASVNHYHFHLFYLSYPLYVETAAVKQVVRDCFEVSDYAVPGFVFIMDDGDVCRLVHSVIDVVDVLVQNNVPHNLFITRGAKLGSQDKKTYSAVKIFLWPRKPCGDDKDKGAFNVACCEISGHLPVKDETSFESITEADVVKALRAECLRTFTEIRPKVIAHLSR